MVDPDLMYCVAPLQASGAPLLHQFAQIILNILFLIIMGIKLRDVTLGGVDVEIDLEQEHEPKCRT